ncbi:MAG: GGDEF domain-containing protein, partial [Dechloromonas sp.]
MARSTASSATVPTTASIRSSCRCGWTDHVPILLPARVPMPLMKRFMLPRRFSAGVAFAMLAVLFVLTFGGMVGLIWVDQQRVIDSAARLQEKTVPEIIRYQRLARNLDQLRQEGERVFLSSSPQARQQAMFVATLVASHPSVLEHPEAASQARQAEHFLAETLRLAVTEEGIVARRFGEWQRLSSRLGLLVDDVSIQGVNLASRDLGEVSAATQLSRVKLSVALAVVGIFLVLFLILLRVHMIHPLQRIDQALSNLGTDRPPPSFEQAAMAEIQAVEAAIGKLHSSLAENERARLALETLANRDGLTGLLNRRHFMITADAELHRAQRYRRPVTIGMADLDFFKKLNDTYGHAAGDTVLRAFAALIQETLRQSDLVCRYGGEEFAFLFPEITVPEAARLAERFRAACANYDIRLADGRVVRV